MGLEHMTPNLSLKISCSCEDSEAAKENFILSVHLEINVKASLGMRDNWKSSSFPLMHRLIAV